MSIYFKENMVIEDKGFPEVNELSEDNYHYYHQSNASTSQEDIIQDDASQYYNDINEDNEVIEEDAVEYNDCDARNQVKEVISRISKEAQLYDYL
jgi:hypothetical protein